MDLNEASEGLRTVPPGMSRGLRFPGDETEEDVLPGLKTALIDKPGASFVRIHSRGRVLVKMHLLSLPLAQNGPIEDGLGSEDEMGAQADHSEAFDIDNLLPSSVGAYMLFYQTKPQFPRLEGAP